MSIDTEAPLTERRSTSMGCSVQAVVTATEPGPHLDEIERRLHELEQRWSRFLPDSEISGLNRAGGEPRRCSRDTTLLVEQLVRAWTATDGAFDPTLLGALVGLGYATSRSDVTRRTSLSGDTAWKGRPDEIVVDHEHDVVRLPIGTTLDPGGLGKGLAADLIADELVDAGVDGALISIGGDLRVTGRPPRGDHWVIRVAPTPDDEPVLVALQHGAVATSSSRLRTWAHPTGTHHHIIDPVRLTPTDGDVIACTVIAGTAAWAETFTKVPFVRGVDEALRVFDRHHLAARITTDDGQHHHTAPWKDFVR